MRATVVYENERRNDVAHGDWTVAQVGNVEPRRNYAELKRLKPAKDLDAEQVQDLKSKTVDGWAENVHELSLDVATFGQVALGIWKGRKISDHFRLDNKRAVRILSTS